MAYRSLERFWQARHPPRYAAYLRPSSPTLPHSSVQKVSNVILNINLYTEDARSGKMEFVKSVDIRGNTDDSRQHGVNYILKNYLLNQP
jgi:hypothetical protein